MRFPARSGGPPPTALVSLALGAALLAACTTRDAEAPPQPAAFSPPADALVEEHVQVAMRDGARLDTDIYVPFGGERPVPAILIRTPYNTEVGGRRSAFFNRLLEDGYALVEQHERGRYFSEGEFTMLPRPAEDGWDTLDWIAEQSWSDGQVVTLGCSSSAENQLKLAAAGHPAHKAMIAMSAGVGVAEAGPFREQGNFWRGGVWQQGWFNYFYGSMKQPWPNFPAGLSDEERQILLSNFEVDLVRDEDASEKFVATRMHLPMVDIMTEMGATDNEIDDYLARGPSHPAWAANRVTNSDVIRVPGLWAEAIYDISARSTVAWFDRNLAELSPAARNNQHMRITQGGHCSFGRETEAASIGDLQLGDARYPYEAELRSWIHRWTGKGNDGLWDDVPAYRAYLADGDWAGRADMPTGGGTLWRLGPDGMMASAETQAGQLSYRYDPADPVISRGGEIGGVGDDQVDGSFDQRPEAARQDVLVFTSPEFRAPRDLLGFARVKLSVASDRPDTDFTVKIIDVFPDGGAFLVGDTILRMRYREGMDREVPMQAGQRYDVELPPILLSRRIETGHRLRVHVSSSNFPNYARSLNSMGDPYTSTDAAVATNTVYFGGNAVSSIELPTSEGLIDYVQPVVAGSAGR
ncbi:hypothetical protein B5C34_03715 [Pacificimonas flava]|uniref:Xaa-Pro dipeptidyl-peptidase C-terminal domain-containing protein n=2 Tax=Pacificimonas TaxID=1960290 RepID=A0A219B2T3_9SPHN|nr:MULTISPECIES: CocE/NonD family hydrolase [Pacificimonas]MBZ6377675.1 CocE/NonD family hydrolase [Pacificimonas aurantium]OWV32645.1 hypothetical protein B5C34_03715 [Pacificimonas flava]